MIVVGLSAGGILAARHLYFREDEEEKIVAENGDTVQMHYVGRLRDNRVYDEERIFDTSYEAIPDEDSPMYTLTFDDRERGEPFEFTLGEGQVIQGWEDNVRGMEEGESKTFFVRPEKGYGEASDDLIFQIDKTETIPMKEEMSQEEFMDIYGEEYGEPAKNMQLEDSFWGWEKIITSVRRGRVTLRHDPEFGEAYNSYGEEDWYSEVISIDSSADGGQGTIEVQHELKESTLVNSTHISFHREEMADVPQIRENEGQSPDDVGIAFEEDGKINIDFNDEVVGQTLIFDVELINIEKED